MKNIYQNLSDSGTHMNNKGRLFIRIKLYLKLKVSLFLRSLISYGEFHIKAVNKSKLTTSKLNSNQVDELAFQEGRKFEKRVKSSPSSMEVKEVKTAKGDLIEPLLRNDLNIKSVLDLGVRDAYYLGDLANNHPEIDFYGISFSSKVHDFHKEIKRSNLHLYDGYALNILEKSSLKYDVAIFMQTATTIGLFELKRYLDVLKKKSKYIVFHEPVYNTWTGNAINPEDISLNEPVAALEFGHCSLFNYKALVDEAGLEILLYRCVSSSDKHIRKHGLNTHMVSLVAKVPE